MKLKTFLAAALLLGFGLSAAYAQSGDDQKSLGDVAKEKNKAKAKRVITDEDMPSTSQPSAPAQQATTTSDSGKDASAESKPESATAAKPANLAQLEGDLKDLNHDEDLLKKRLEQLQQKADNTTDPFRKQMYLDSIANQQTTLEQFKKQRKELEQRIAGEKSKTKS